MAQISILGCGWLGLPLAKTLMESGFLVNGSTTSVEKMQVLENSGINPFLIALSENKIEGDMTQFLENSEMLLIDIPPKLRAAVNENFVAKIQNAIPFIEKSSIKKVIFISSTSVYGDENNSITEETSLNPVNESGKQLVAVEGILQSNKNFKATILRFGGLIGEERNPVHFLAGKLNLENPEAPINLIHQQDCIGIILKIIETNSWGTTFNAVTPYHPSRKIYYTQKALELKLPLPEFEDAKPPTGKIISTDKIEKELNYTYKKPLL